MTKKAEVRRCLCGCGEPTSSNKRLFVQGHDAKLAKAVREVWSGTRDASEIPAEVWALYEKGELPVLAKAREQLLQAKDSIEVKLERERAKLKRQQDRVNDLEAQLVAAVARKAEQEKLDAHKAANEKAQAKASEGKSAQ